MLKRFRADLHIHTCLSPCASLDMTPRRILQEADRKGLHIIALSDHNSAENLSALETINTALTVIPAMEITTSEEAHILALLPDSECAFLLQQQIYRHLPVIPESRRFISEQVIVDGQDNILGFCDKLLLNAVNMNAKDVIEIIHRFEGIAIASHIDREVYSLLTQLGFIPEELNLDALEISFRTGRKQAKSLFSEYSHLPWIWNSDAHAPEDIGRVFTEFYLKEPTFEELKLAFKGINGRKILN